MKIKGGVFRSVVMLLVCFLSVAAAGQAFSFADARAKVEKALEEGKGTLDFSRLPEFTGYILGGVRLTEARLEISPKEKDLLVLTGKGALPKDFQGLGGKTVEMVVTITPSPATVREKNDMLCTLTGFFPTFNLADWYKGQKGEIFDLLTLEKSFVSWSSAKMNLPSDALPATARTQFAGVFGEPFVLSLDHGATLYTRIQTGRVEPFQTLAGLFKNLDPDLRFSLFLCPNPADIKAQVQLANVRIPFLPPHETGGTPYLFLNAKPFAFGLGLAVLFKLPPHDDQAQGVLQVSIPLFSGKTPAKPHAASLLANLQGTWRDAAGIKGLTMYDLVLKGEVPLVGPGVVIGLAGKADLGKTRLELAGKIPTGAAGLQGAFMGKVNLLPFGDLFAFLLKAGEPGKKEKSDLPVDKLALKNVQVSVAATDDRDLNITPGSTFREPWPSAVRSSA